jgi:hypothetical protein
MGKNIKILNIRSDKLHIGVDIPSRADVLPSIVIGIHCRIVVSSRVFFLLRW